MQTALHILGLVRQLQREAVGGRIVSSEWYRKERAAYLFIKQGKNRLALGIVYHPAGSGCFLVPASKVRLETREKPWPIFDAEGATIASVKQHGLDRLFEIGLDHATRRHYLAVEALGPNANIWHLDEEHCLLGTLRKREFQPGRCYDPPALPPHLDPTTAVAEDLADRRRRNEGLSAVQLIEKHVLGFNRRLAVEVVERTERDLGRPVREEGGDETVMLRIMRELIDRFVAGEPGYLHTTSRGLEAYPFKLTIIEEPPQRFKTLSLAVKAAAELRQDKVEKRDERQTIMQAVRRHLKKLERLEGNVAADLKKASDYDRYRRYAELLQINYDRLEKGMESVKVNDVYRDPPQPVEIKLDPALSPQDNIERYARRYRKGRDGHEVLGRRLELTRMELDKARTMITELEDNFEAARQRYQEEIQSLLPHEGGSKRETKARLPYREHLLSTGLRVFVGRDGTNNDRTTFEFAKPYELWFHTQQCPGSHVVMKYPNKSFEPSSQEIAEAAALAAWHSKARNDTLVPVIYTERRYVRKPRKAKPGLVTVDREKSVMVEPKRPE